MAVIGLMAVNHSNLTNGFSRMGELLSVLRCAPFQYAGTLPGQAKGYLRMGTTKFTVRRGVHTLLFSLKTEIN